MCCKSQKSINLTQAAIGIAVLLMLFFSLMPPVFEEVCRHEHHNHRDIDDICEICLKTSGLKDRLAVNPALFEFFSLFTIIHIILTITSFIPFVSLVNLKTRMND